MRRTDQADTSEWARRAQIELLRKQTPEQKLRMTLEMMEFGRQIRQQSEKRRRTRAS